MVDNIALMKNTDVVLRGYNIHPRNESIGLRVCICITNEFLRLLGKGTPMTRGHRSRDTSRDALYTA